MFHPVISERIMQMGRAYEKLSAATHTLEQDYLNFCKEAEQKTKQFLALSNQQIELVGQPSISSLLMGERIRKIEQIVELEKQAMPDMKILVYESKPLFAKIYDFGSQLKKDLFRLADSQANKSRSKIITEHLETQYKLIEKHYADLDARLEKVKENRAKSLKIYNSLVN